MKIKHKKKGFTLVEMVIVMGVVALVIPALFSIIFMILQQQLKVYALQEVKRQGDNTLVLMESIIRNYGNSIYDRIEANAFVDQKCFSSEVPNNSFSTTDTQNDFVIKDRYGNGFRYYLTNDDKIVSSSAFLVNNVLTNYVNVDLTTNKVEILNLKISCNRTAQYSPPIISFSFDVKHASIDYTINYQSKVKLKSY